MRGYSVVALDNPKDRNNVGSVIRACSCYSASMIVISGKRYQRSQTDTVCGYRHIPLLHVDDVFNAIPYDCIPVAVDLLPDATNIKNFVHPERAFYIFGAEDATLGRRITERCKYKIFVPTAYCMNLAATVNVILFDRLMKVLG